MLHRIITVTLAVLTFAACARAYPPPGGERDTTPPRLIGTTPEPLAVVDPLDTPVVFHFDERLSERNFTESLVVVSPLDGAIRVQRSGREVRVRIDGGWRPGRVYSVVLLPGVRDLFNNARTDAAEIVFSTGPEVPATAMAGIVLDRITGRPPQQGVVNAIRREDGAAYMTMTDTAGFFSLRHLPLGEYDMVAYGDQNRNRRRDPAEPVDSGRVATLATAADTVTLVFSVLPEDTTPPRVVRAEAVDSMHVRVIFDDYFDIDEQVLAGATAEVHALPDSVPFAAAHRVLPAPAWDRARAAAAAAARAEAAARADTLDAPDTPPSPPRPAREQQQREQPLLPSRELVVELDRPLEAGRPYTITVAGAVNISGLAGGGVARFETRPRPERPERPPPGAPDPPPPGQPDPPPPEPAAPPPGSGGAGRR
jgi:hypothetical protein